MIKKISQKHNSETRSNAIAFNLHVNSKLTKSSQEKILIGISKNPGPSLSKNSLLLFHHASAMEIKLHTCFFWVTLPSNIVTKKMLLIYIIDLDNYYYSIYINIYHTYIYIYIIYILYIYIRRTSFCKLIIGKYPCFQTFYSHYSDRNQCV